VNVEPVSKYCNDLAKLKEKNPANEEEFTDLFEISGSSPEGYYVSLLFDWINSCEFKNRGEFNEKRN